jgi:hypothetical protein
MSLPTAALAGTYPVRSAVYWGRYPKNESNHSSKPVTGRRVIIIQFKKFRRLERIASKILGGRNTLRRPLDEMMSAVWELADGSRTFEEICTILDALFEEDVAPVKARTGAAVELLARNGCIEVLTRPFGGAWNIGPGLEHGNEDKISPPEWLDVAEHYFERKDNNTNLDTNATSRHNNLGLIDPEGLGNQEE